MSEKLQITNQNSQSFDVIIIGGGAAGISAAMWCDELGLKALLLESETELGGQLLRVFNPIKNHLGVESENGRALLDIFVSQVTERKFTIHYKSEITKVDLKAKTVFLKNGETFSSQALVIATGVRRRKLGVKGEDKFKGRGIIESGKRDQALVKGKSVCIVGGGDAALENALILSKTAAHIFLVHRSKNFRARSEFTEKVLTNEKVKVLTETVVTKTIGREKLEALELQNLKTTEIFTLPIEALLIRIGVEPNIELFQGNLNLDKNGYIEIDGNCETNVENVFAIGDVANPFAPTVSSAVGMGATAAKVIFHNLNNNY